MIIGPRSLAAARRPAAFLCSLLLLAGSGLACIGDRALPVPRADTGVPPIPPPQLSRFDVPLTYDFTKILQTVERVVPTTFGSLDTIREAGSDGRAQYAFAATRGRFSAFARGSEVHLRATLAYSARGYYTPPIGPRLSGACGTRGQRPELVVELVAPLTLTPDWHLASKARVAELRPASSEERDRCRISFLSLDVTERVMDAARLGLTAHLARIDSTVAKVDLTRQATKWWAHLNRPVRLADGIWLLLQPTQLRLKGFTGRDQILVVEAGMDAYPRVVMGERPAPKVPPLPPLGNDTGSTGFRVALTGQVDYAAASRTLTERIQGDSVVIEGRVLRVRTLTVSRDPNGQLALLVRFAGDVAGTLQLVGTPRYARAPGRVTVDDLTFALDTDSRLGDAYAWLRGEAVLDFLRARTVLPLAPLLDDSARLIELGVNRTVGGVVALAGSVDSVSVLGIYVGPKGLIVQALVEGNGRVAVRPRR